jgi:hypothetical protein
MVVTILQIAGFLTGLSAFLAVLDRLEPPPSSGADASEAAGPVPARSALHHGRHATSAGRGTASPVLCTYRVRGAAARTADHEPRSTHGTSSLV